MKEKLLIIMMLAAICFPSCTKKGRKGNAVKIVREWTGKEIRYPSDLSCMSMGKDTTCVDLYNDNFKILLFVDSLGCTSCRLKLHEWKRIMNESDSVFIRKPEFVFIFQSKKSDGKELQNIFRNNGFRHPVFIDKENETDKINHFPSNPEYQCFLLDKDNKVVMVGNPSLSSGIWTLYKRVIAERETSVKTMGKAEEFTSYTWQDNADASIYPQKRKEAAKKLN